MKKEYLHLLTKALLAFLVLSGVALSVFGISNNLNDQGLIARIVANILVEQQYSHKKLDDNISKDFFDEYLKTLDPFKFYFTKEDIEQTKDEINESKDDLEKLSKYRTSLDDMVKEGNISFATLATDRLLKRVKEYKAFAEEQLKKGFDFTKKEDFLINRKDADYPTKAEQKDLWRKKLKNDYLNALLIEKISKENLKKDKVSKKDKDKAEVQKLWKKTPEERILKRIASTIKMIENWEEIDKLELFINTLAHVYDPHSAYMSPKTLADFDIAMRLSLIGIGAVLTTEDGYTKVVRIIKGGPASKNGKLEPEDRIIAVAQGDGPPEDIIDMPLSDVVDKIRGKKNTKVRLTIIKGKKGLGSVPEEISITRDVVKLKDKSAHKKIKEITLPDGSTKKIGIIELPSFYINFEGAAHGEKNYTSASRDVKKILEELNKENVDGIVLDLRNNGGGALIEAIRLTGLFIDSGPVVQVKGISAPKAKIHYDLDNKTYFNGPLIVMVNKGSASATEILAGALQDYGRAIIVGDEHTHGKGTVQTVLQLKEITKYYGVKFDPGAFKLTNAMFYRINGDSTQIKGVVPDIIFPSYYDALKTGEKTLKHALPFATVEPANYIYSKKYTKFIPELKKNSEERVKNNKEFSMLKNNIDTLKKLNDRKTVTLNMDERWQEYKKEKELLDKEAKLFEEDSDDDTKDKDAKKKKDIILDETVNIMSDILTDMKPENTEQNTEKHKSPKANNKEEKTPLNTKKAESK